jgi:hypothetical protein
MMGGHAMSVVDAQFRALCLDYAGSELRPAPTPRS